MLNNNLKVCHSLIHLTLEELFVLKYMQTDPNWSNFLYDNVKNKVMIMIINKHI